MKITGTIGQGLTVYKIDLTVNAPSLNEELADETVAATIRFVLEHGDASWGHYGPMTDWELMRRDWWRGHRRTLRAALEQIDMTIKAANAVSPGAPESCEIPDRQPGGIDEETAG